MRHVDKLINKPKPNQDSFNISRCPFGLNNAKCKTAEHIHLRSLVPLRRSSDMSDGQNQPLNLINLTLAASQCYGKNHVSECWTTRPRDSRAGRLLFPVLLQVMPGRTSPRPHGCNPFQVLNPNPKISQQIPYISNTKWILKGLVTRSGAKRTSRSERRRTLRGGTSIGRCGCSIPSPDGLS